jgi:hypothetical protein
MTLLMPEAPAVTGEERASRLVPCDRCGAARHQPCAAPDGTSHGARRLLAVERGHLDPDTGEWLTRGWWS